MIKGDKMAKKLRKTTIKTREELEQVLGEYAQQVLERDRLTVAMEREIAEIRQRYEQPIAACVDVGDGLFDDILAWASLHPDAFGDRKSLDLLHGRIGFRIGPPAVRQISGVKTEHSVELLMGTDWVRVKYELDKERILADMAAGHDDVPLREAGLQIVRTETFYADIKREDGKEVK